MSDENRLSPLAAAFGENALCAAIYVDKTGTIRSWNRGAEVLLGHSAEQAVGRRADLIVPEPYRAAHWAGFHRALPTSWRGSPGWAPIEPQHRDGSLVSLESFLLPFEEPPGGLRGILALFRQRVSTG